MKTGDLKRLNLNARLYNIVCVSGRPYSKKEINSKPAIILKKENHMIYKDASTIRFLCCGKTFVVYIWNIDVSNMFREINEY